MEIPWTIPFTRIKFEGLSNSISKFIDDTEEIRLFWITYNFAQKRKGTPSDEQMNYFIDNYGINKSYQTNYNFPEIPNHLTIKMVRYLVKKPHLIYTWFLSNKHIILVPLYYEMFCDTINDLYEILNEGYKHLEDDENNSIDSFDLYQVILPLYCQNTLLTNLINQVKFVELSDVCLTILCDTFKKNIK